MLLGNSINGISISIDAITTSLVEDKPEIELFLSFGATKYEAISRIFSFAVQKGAMPVLNMMRLVGIVSIPGMMTGQLLGGSSVMVAARYQMMILFLIAICTLSTILASSFMVIESSFCAHQLLKPDHFVKNHEMTLFGTIFWLGGGIVSGTSGEGSDGSYIMYKRLNEMENASSISSTGLNVFPLMEPKGDPGFSVLDVFGLGRSFSDGPESFGQRVLFQDVSFELNEGELFLVQGASGTGKSEFFRILAGLSPIGDGSIQLDGKDWKDEYTGNGAAEWRKQVLYVTQNKVQIPGTPIQFIRKINSFDSWKGDNELYETIQDMVRQTSTYLFKWGLNMDCLEKEWNALSGGEAQRVLLAIAMSSKPRVLLLDEVTSALDMNAKLSVEQSIREYMDEENGSVLWISHDDDLPRRMLQLHI
jgi:ABC-type iron transport system FetAB ATPase subunit